MLKKCSHCKLELSLNNFTKNQTSKDGFNLQCKSCVKQYNKKYYFINQEHQKKYHKKWRLKNPEYHKKYNKKIRLSNPLKLIESCKKWRLKNPEYMKEYIKKHKKEINIYLRKKYATDTQYKLTKLLRTRLWDAVKGNFKSGSAVRDLGCTIPELKVYLEKQFKEGMGWKNHNQWHIDHKIPLSSFNLIKREQLLKAVNYTNLQPLWAQANQKKSNKILEEYLT